jgi:hypothetical protein
MSRLVMLPIARQVPAFMLVSPQRRAGQVSVCLRIVGTPRYSAVKSSRSRLSGSSSGINTGHVPVAQKQRS